MREIGLVIQKDPHLKGKQTVWMRNGEVVQVTNSEGKRSKMLAKFDFEPEIPAGVDTMIVGPAYYEEIAASFAASQSDGGR